MTLEEARKELNKFRNNHYMVKLEKLAVQFVEDLYKLYEVK